MSDERKQPWPASWPPFWRAVVHVAIAAGVGNAAFHLGLFLTFLLPPLVLPPHVAQYAPVMAVPLSWGTTVLAAIIPAILVRTHRGIRIALVAGFSLGWLAMAPCLYLSYGLMGVAVNPFKPRTLDGVAVGIPVVFLGSYLIVACFAKCIRVVDPKRATGSWVVGGCMLSAANSWAYVAIARMIQAGPCALPPPLRDSSLTVATQGVWALGLYNLAYAVMARMLINAAEEAKAAGEK